jgi:hypothetical protein
MEVGDIDQATRVKSFFEKDEQWKCAIWLDSAAKGRVVVAVKSEKWAFLLPQPDYSIPIDLSPFPKRDRPRMGAPGSIISTFRRPHLVDPTTPPARTKRDSEKDDPKSLNFVERMIEKLSTKGDNDDRSEEKPGIIKYLEDLKKISK